MQIFKPFPRKSSFFVLIGLLLLTFGPHAVAQIRYVDVLSAIVGLESRIPGAARSAAFLGTERQGSGVLIDSSGLILTVGYLILEASGADIILNDGSRVPVDIIGYDYDTGFGLVRTHQPLAGKPLVLGNPGTLKETDEVLVMAFGGPEMVRPAVVSSRHDFAGYWEYLLEDAIFTSPPHPKFSGAALISSEGTLLGIGSLYIGDVLATDEGLTPGNMFIPVDQLQPIIADMLTHGRPATAPRPWLGVYLQETRGFLFVTRLAEDGPAARAGLAAGDIIATVAGATPASLEDFYRKLWALGDAGVTVPLAVLRSGAGVQTFDINSGDRYDWLHVEPARQTP